VLFIQAHNLDLEIEHTTHHQIPKKVLDMKNIRNMPNIAMLKNNIK